MRKILAIGSGASPHLDSLTPRGKLEKVPCLLVIEL